MLELERHVRFGRFSSAGQDDDVEISAFMLQHMYLMCSLLVCIINVLYRYSSIYLPIVAVSNNKVCFWKKIQTWRLPARTRPRWV